MDKLIFKQENTGAFSIFEEDNIEIEYLTGPININHPSGPPPQVQIMVMGFSQKTLSFRKEFWKINNLRLIFLIKQSN